MTTDLGICCVAETVSSCFQHWSNIWWKSRHELLTLLSRDGDSRQPALVLTTTAAWHLLILSLHILDQQASRTVQPTVAQLSSLLQQTHQCTLHPGTVVDVSFLHEDTHHCKRGHHCVGLPSDKQHLIALQTTVQRLYMICKCPGGQLTKQTVLGMRSPSLTVKKADSIPDYEKGGTRSSPDSAVANP